MTSKPFASILALTARSMTGVAVVAAAVSPATAYCAQSGAIDTVSNTINAASGTNSATATTGIVENVWTVLQRKTAEMQGVPVEKTLDKSGIALRFIPAGSSVMDSSNNIIRVIPTGTFVMGSSSSETDREDNETQHTVKLTKSFYMGRFEVTQGQWKKVMGSNPAFFKNVGDTGPVENVSWDDCTNFMVKLAAFEGMPGAAFRLPTEAEWEYACRAGTQSPFCYGGNLDSSMANFNGNYPYGGGSKGEYRGKTAPVGLFRPNAWGLYDMHGNVMEWCADWHGVYEGDVTDPHGPAKGSSHMVRGGSWNYGAKRCRSAYRVTPDYVSHSIGFRICLTVDR